MAHATRSIIVDGPEGYYIRRIIARGTKEITLLDRIVAAYFIQYYYFRDYGSFMTSRIEAAKVHGAAWQAFWSGDSFPLRQLVEDETRATQLMSAMGNAEFGDPAVRWRILLYTVITLLVVFGTFKLFGM